MIPRPDFYDPKRIADVYVERAALVAEAATLTRKSGKVRAAAQDGFRIAAFGIDCQVGFATPGASLFVPGAVEDTARATGFIYDNLDKLTLLAFSLDTHRVFQIFHPAWWLDEHGRHPEPFTPITSKDLRDGKYQPIAHPQECQEYVKRLEADGKYLLTIWPYHTLLGGVSHALVPSLMEAAIYHSIVRSAQTHFETKGTHAMTENYSVLSPEVRELGGKSVGTFNAAFFKMLMEYDRVYVFGQAKSHCVLSTLRDMQKHVAAIDPCMMQKIWVLEDAMSPVPPPPLSPLPPELDFPRIAEEAFRELEKAGMRMVKTTDPVTI